MIEYIFKPIDTWPREFTKERRRNSPFHKMKTVSNGVGGTYKQRQEIPFDTLMRELALEVERAGGKRVVLQLALEASKIRRDGLPYSEARPEHPGVIVSFETKNGPVKMPCDTFVDWRDNVRAITLTLEHLRGVDRYGVSRHGEQYRGWTALPPAPGAQAMTFDEAASTLSELAPFVSASWIQTDADAFKMAYKVAQKKSHPDAGGSDEKFKQVELAAEVLRRHHGVEK